jgi:hypothetical protein
MQNPIIKIGDQVYFIKHIHEAYKSRLCLYVDKVLCGNSCQTIGCATTTRPAECSNVKLLCVCFPRFNYSDYSLVLVVSVPLDNSARLFWSLVGLWRRKFWLLMMRLSRNAMSLHRLSAKLRYAVFSGLHSTSLVSTVRLHMRTWLLCYVSCLDSAGQ